MSGFSQRLLHWQAGHGRQGLPWQGSRDPYRVWLSEVMLQQTQVATVIDYFARFTARFPDVRSLAAASLDEVLALWSGLGYYSRARNLHRCAQAVVAQHGGEFPRSAEVLQTLPGIGRSTAAAIASFCFGERAAILDANVRRVLTRVLGFDADLSSTANGRALWELATDMLPTESLADDMPRYTQGVMDLGATVCLPRQPSCLLCPVHPICRGFREGAPERYPVKTRKLKRSAQSLWLLWAQRGDGAVWLEKRPTPGVWAGLYCLPLFDSFDALHSVLPAPTRKTVRELQTFTHVLTHKDLHLHPVAVSRASKSALTEGIDGAWFAADEWPALG